MTWAQIVAVLEKDGAERWQEFSTRYGDWGRDAGLGRRVGRLNLAELGALVGGLDYAAVGQALSRFGKRHRRVCRVDFAVSSILLATIVPLA